MNILSDIVKSVDKLWSHISSISGKTTLAEVGQMTSDVIVFVVIVVFVVTGAFRLLPAIWYHFAATARRSREVDYTEPARPTPPMRGQPIS